MIKINVVELPINESDNRYKQDHYKARNKVSHEVAKTIREKMPNEDCICGGVTIITIDTANDNRRKIDYCCDDFEKICDEFQNDPYTYELVTGNTQEELDKKVNYLIKLGWQIDAELTNCRTMLKVRDGTKEYKEMVEELRKSTEFIK